MFSRTIKVMLVGALVAGSTVGVARPATIKTDAKVTVGTNDQWKKRHIYVSRGKDGKAKVTWKNPTGQRDHDVKSVNTEKRWWLKRKMLKPRNRNKAEKVFKKNGNYHFICTIHSTKFGSDYQGMTGIIHVRK